MITPHDYSRAEFTFATKFLEDLANARKYGMGSEFLEWFLEDLAGDYETFQDALDYANREWDLK